MSTYILVQSTLWTRILATDLRSMIAELTNLEVMMITLMDSHRVACFIEENFLSDM